MSLETLVVLLILLFAAVAVWGSPPNRVKVNGGPSPLNKEPVPQRAPVTAPIAAARGGPGA